MTRKGSIMLWDQGTGAFSVSARPAFVTLGLFGLVLLLRTTAAIGDDSPEMRTWTSTAGTPARAALLDVEARQARLKFADGTEKLVPIDQLSADDQEYIGQWLERRANKPPQIWKRFRNRSTGQQFDGMILERVNVKGQRKLFVRDKTGLTAWLWEALFEISDVPVGTSAESPVEQTTPPPPVPPGSGEIKIALTPAAPPAQTVLVTGSGTTPDEADKNALSAAIERVVGVLVDAESLVKNDEVVRDQVLTFSRGYINEYQEIRRWEENGLHYATIAANVSVTKLGEKLKQVPGIATKVIDGGLLKNLLEIDRQNEELAREVFRRAVAGFKPDKLLTLTMLDKLPVVKDTGAKVTLTVDYRLSSNLDAWKTLHADLKTVLDAIAFTHAQYTCTTKPQRFPGRDLRYSIDWDSTTPLVPKSDGQVRVYLCRDCTEDCNTTSWDGYLAYPSFQQEMASVAAGHARYRLRFQLVDSENRAIAELDRGLGNALVVSWSPSNRFGVSSIGPLPYAANTFRTSRVASVTFTITPEQLARVDTCRGSIQIVENP
jgi:hypothetical protein